MHYKIIKPITIHVTRGHTANEIAITVSQGRIMYIDGTLYHVNNALIETIDNDVSCMRLWEKAGCIELLSSEPKQT